MRPWTVSAAAIRAWQELTDTTDRDVAGDELLEAAERVQQRYARNPDLRPEPRLGHPSLHVYRGGRPDRLRLLVDVVTGEVVDVLGFDGGGRDYRRDTPSKQRRRARRAAAREGKQST